MEIVLKNWIIILVSSIVLFGCGRKGALELPSSAVKKTTQRTFVDKNKTDKPFILDRLIK
ncbi:LPS translocon maturation chaperone LptM [Bartonella sp. B30(2025)]